MKKIKITDVELMVKTMVDTGIRNEAYFVELDSKAGDGDFGTSLATGFKVILEKWDEYDRSTIGQFLLKVAMVITSHVGGSSGPIWGTAYMKAGLYAKDKTELDLADIIAMLRAAITGIMARGGAQLGDKTLLDGLAPATDALEAAHTERPNDYAYALQKATQAATLAIETTRDWKAMRGRQSFTGDRSRGTDDPGLVAIAIVFQDVQQAFAHRTA